MVKDDSLSSKPGTDDIGDEMRDAFAERGFVHVFETVPWDIRVAFSAAPPTLYR